MRGTILSVDGITKRFGGLVALEEVSFDVHANEIIGLMGPNGAGKTTLINIIAGETPPDRGRVLFRDQDITNLPPHRICRLGIARTYQIPQPFLSLSVKDNLRVSSLFGQRKKKVSLFPEHDEILELVGLLAEGEIPAGNLSVIGLKRLELARALASQPEVLLLDEVAAGSTETEIPKILSTLRQIKTLGITIVLIEHVMKVMVNAVDRIVAIDKGKKVAEGPPDEVMNDPRVIESYFGS